MNNELFKPLNTKSKITVMYHLGNFYTYPTMKNTKLNYYLYWMTCLFLNWVYSLWQKKPKFRLNQNMSTISIIHQIYIEKGRFLGFILFITNIRILDYTSLLKISACIISSFNRNLQVKPCCWAPSRRKTILNRNKVIETF
jgi:hypothetical protein